VCVELMASWCDSGSLYHHLAGICICPDTVLKIFSWCGCRLKLGVMIGLDETVASARISRYEGGVHEPPISTARALAEALGVPLGYLYCDDDRLAEIILAASELPGTTRRRCWSLCVSVCSNCAQPPENEGRQPLKRPRPQRRSTRSQVSVTTSGVCRPGRFAQMLYCQAKAFIACKSDTSAIRLYDSLRSCKNQ